MLIRQPQRKILTDAVGSERLLPYFKQIPSIKLIDPENHQIQNLYLSNLKTCSKLYKEFHWLEIILRNSINNSLTKEYSQDWFSHNKLNLQEVEKIKIKNAINRVTKERGLINNQSIISSLTLGFWINLFNSPYENLWRKCLRNSFQGNVTITRKEIRSKLNTLLKIRNKIAHYEPITTNFSYSKITQNIQEIISLINQNFLSLIKLPK